MSYTEIMFQARKGTQMKRNWHQDTLCSELERVVAGMTKRLIINVPPRTGKTEIAVKNFMSWSGGLFPDSEFINASYSAKLAAANTYETRSIMTMDEYQQIFPWVQLRHDSKAKDDFRTTQGGVFYAAGAEGSITGYGAGKMRSGFGGAIIIDDPHKAYEASKETPTTRQNIIEWFTNTIENRKNNFEETPIIVIMQRLHQEDLSGFLLDGGNGEEWRHVCISALDDDDESFWPDHMPTEQLRQMQHSNRIVFSGQYEQNPVPKGGATFQRDWFDIVPAAPAETQWVRAWDLAGSDERDSAFTAGVKIGVAPDNHYYIADSRRRQVRGNKVVQLMQNTATQDGFNTKGSFPQDPGSAGKSWAEYLVGKMAPYDYRFSPETGAKETRAEGFAAQAEAGNVHLVKGPWNKDYLDEIETFPVGKWKDQVDATSRGFMELQEFADGGLQVFVL